EDFKIECPARSGKFVTINDAAEEIGRRLARLFLKDESGTRPVSRYHPKLATDPHFRDYVLFHEYFHGDNGRGVGASHQTGWTGLIAKILQPRVKTEGAEETKASVQIPRADISGMGVATGDEAAPVSKPKRSAKTRITAKSRLKS
ncbi:MAG TPA: glucosidase, partial [Verrucomicrobiae bacterium]